jgi:hypothetical protein
MFFEYQKKVRSFINVEQVFYAEDYNKNSQKNK